MTRPKANPLTPAERGRMGGLVGGRPRKGKYTLATPWYERALRDHVEVGGQFDFDTVLALIHERNPLRGRRRAR